MGKTLPRRSKRLLERKADDEDESPPQIEEKRRPPRKRKTAANHQQQQSDVPPILLKWGGSRRDRSGLDDGPAGVIAERVLANDVADYIRFRSVCRPWRRCCADPRARSVLEYSRLHPRRWIMLLESESENLGPAAAAAPHCSRRRRRFLNVSTGQCIQVDIPELRDHGLLHHSATDGLLLLLGKAAPAATGAGALRLLNPLTRQVAELPPFSAGLHFSPGCSQSNSGLVGGGSRVLLYVRGHDTLALAKPGDERWVLVKISDVLMPTMSFAGRFYGVAADNSTVMVVDTDTDTNMPRLVVAAKLSTPIRPMTDTAHLVENAGELMLVHRRLRRVRGAGGEYNEHKRTYKVYRVNLATGKTTPAAARGPRGRAIFLGFNRALSVSPQIVRCSRPSA